MDSHEPAQCKSSDPSVEQPTLLSPEEQANVISRLFFFWASPLMERGWLRYKKKEFLVLSDLLPIPRSERADRAFEHYTRGVAAWTAAHPGQPLSILTVLLKAFHTDVLKGAVFRVLQDAATIGAPFVMQQLIIWFGKTALAPDTVNSYDGFFWALGLGLIQFCAWIFQNASLFYTNKAFANMRTATAMAVYDKATRIESAGKMVGRIQQMHTSDTYKFVDVSQFVHSIWATPADVVAALISLYYFVGWAGLLALGVVFITTPIQFMLMKGMMMSRMETARTSDKRLTALSAFCQGVRTVKFMSWEPNVMADILKLRAAELESIKKGFFGRSMLLTVMFAGPMLISLTVFGCAYAFNTPIQPQNVFPAMAMMNFLRGPLTQLPLAAGRLIDIRMSLLRINEFMNMPDKIRYSKTIDSAAYPNTSVIIRNATAQVKPDGGELQDLMGPINLEIPKGKLTIIVGKTGSGKSTLMNTIIGEMRLKDDGGEVLTESGIAYLTQEAWIMNASLKDNVLVGLPLDEERYKRTINACQLIPDLEQLTDSDRTEIGERGINISGGQKQRVAFARAVYSGRSVVLMDDPLSAVDSHVCSALFEQCIVGALAGKTRVLITHQIQFLSRADHVIVVDGLKVVFSGSYDDLLASEATTGLLSLSPAEARSPNSAASSPNNNNSSSNSPTHIASTATSASSPLRDIPEPKKEVLRSKSSGGGGGGGKLMSTEFQVQGKIKWVTLLWYCRRQGLGWVIITIVAFAAAQLLSTVANLILSWWSSRTDILGYSLTQPQYVQYYGIFVGGAIIGMLVQMVPFNTSMLNSARQCHENMMVQLLRAPSWFFDTTPTGRIISRFSKDLEGMDVQIPWTLGTTYQLVFMILGSVGVMCYTVPYLTIMVVFVICIYLGMLSYYGATNRAQKRLEAVNRTPMTAIMNETLSGLPTIRAYGLGPVFTAKHEVACNNCSLSTYNWRLSLRWLSIRVAFIVSSIVLIAGIVFSGVMQSYNRKDRLTALPVMALSMTNTIAMAQFIAMLTFMSSELESSLNSVERIKEYCDDLPQERDAEYTGENPAPEPSWPQTGRVVFEKASLRYRDGLPLVLKDVSLTIEAGWKVGVVGRTGSGKSTILLALFRLVELAAGRITIDDRDISSLRMRDLRTHLTIIPQDPLLFEGTVRSNLDPFGQSDDDAILEAVKSIGLLQRVNDAQGLDTAVSERGQNFSVGERQLMCLGRALLKKSRLLLLDEATASVDFESDAKIQAIIRKQFAACTVITIAHRLATVADSDRILVMDEGVVAEYETPSALLEDPSSQFHAMVKALGNEQFDHVVELARSHTR